MTNLIKYSAVVLILTVSILIFEHFNTLAKIENFCDTRDMPKEECYCMVDFMRYHTSKEVRNDFMKAIGEGNLFGYPNLIVPSIGAIIKCQKDLKK